MTRRLPVVNSDDGAWGDWLNNFLLKEHFDTTNTPDVANGGHKTITIRPGTTAAATAPLKFTSGALMSTPEAGAMEYDGTSLLFTPATTRYNAIMNGLGLSGGQTVIGGTLTTQNLSLRPNAADLTTGAIATLGTLEATNSTTGSVTVAGGLAVNKRVYATDMTVTNAITANAVIAGYAATATTPVTITVGSAYQQYCTYSGNQVVNMPDVTSSVVVGQQWQIISQVPSTNYVTINTTGGTNRLIQLYPGASATLTCVSTANNNAASWSVSVGVAHQITVANQATVGTNGPLNAAVGDIWIDTTVV